MGEEILIGLASIIILGILAQWFAWRLHLPAILLLLIFGIIAGPATGLIHPDQVFGDLLFPLVSVSVAIILFEGGLNLKIKELRTSGRVIRNLTTIGILITWILITALAYLLLRFSLSQSLLVGAILVVSGPTVIMPILRQVRPKGQVGSIVKWEGIVNDPIGAIIAVLVFEVILAGGMEAGGGLIISGVLKALGFGIAFGLLGAGMIVILLRKYLIPDFLQNPVSLMIVVMIFVLTNHLQGEAGLLAVTVMGIALTNQKYVSIKHIFEFKEILRVILISSLFIILAARLPVSEILFANPLSWIFVAILILVVRPLTVFASTMGTRLKTNEKLFLSWMAPRGIVAAAVISVFAIRLSEVGTEGVEKLVQIVFQVIIGTVAVYGLTASYVARKLKVASAEPQGILFAGAQGWILDIALMLKEEGFAVVLVDSNWSNAARARSKGIDSYYGNVLSENLFYDLPLDGIGKLLAVTPNDEVNSLAALHFEDIFGRSEVYQLPPRSKNKNGDEDDLPKHLRGRYLFDEQADFRYLVSRFQSGAIVKKTPITEEFDLEDFNEKYNYSAIPLFIIRESGKLQVCTAQEKPLPKAGQTLISLVDPGQKDQEKVGKGIANDNGKS